MIGEVPRALHGAAEFLAVTASSHNVCVLVLWFLCPVPPAPASILILYIFLRIREPLSISGVLKLLLNEQSLFTCTFHFMIMRTLCRKHILQDQIFVNELRICWAANPPAWSCQSSLFTLDPWLVKSTSCRLCWVQCCQVHIFSTELGYF